MNKIHNIIKEEIRKFIKEYYDESEYFSLEDDLKMEMFQDFLYKNNNDFTKYAPWKVIPFARLKKVWEDFMQYGHVRDGRGLEMIEDIMVTNTIKVGMFTTLAGHTQWGDEEAFEENIGYWVDRQVECVYPQIKQDINQLEIPFNNPKQGYVKKEPVPDPEPCTTTVHPFVTQYIEEKYYGELPEKTKFRNDLYDEMKYRFYDYYMDDPNHELGGFISDYGLEPLQKLLGQLLRTESPEQKVPILDQMLNVVHQRSDIASWFVEGGSSALSKLSSSPSEVTA